jgi:hypothetical protein
MANLFWKRKTKTVNLISKPFATEDEFERTVFNTKELFEEITWIKRQIRGGKKPGIPDVIGIDGEGNICILEMKNVSVNEDILSQVLKYAIWAESNPDSIKNLWHETDSQPDIEVNWDNYNVRILVIAPDIDTSILNFKDKIHYDIELIEIKRWINGKDAFLLVNTLETKANAKVKITRGLQSYDRSFYEKEHDVKSVQLFFNYIKEVENLLKAKGYDLEKKFNKHYCGFKYGFFNVFTLQWISSKTMAFTFRIPEREANKLYKGTTRYWRKRIFCYIEPGKTKVGSFWPLIQKCLENKSVE